MLRPVTTVETSSPKDVKTVKKCFQFFGGPIYGRALGKSVKGRDHKNLSVNNSTFHNYRKCESFAIDISVLYK